MNPRQHTASGGNADTTNGNTVTTVYSRYDEQVFCVDLVFLVFSCESQAARGSPASELCAGRATNNVGGKGDLHSSSDILNSDDESLADDDDDDDDDVSIRCFTTISFSPYTAPLFTAPRAHVHLGGCQAQYGRYEPRSAPSTSPKGTQSFFRRQDGTCSNNNKDTWRGQSGGRQGQRMYFLHPRETQVFVFLLLIIDCD